MTQPKASPLHPHEPEEAPVLDAYGRCLVCALRVCTAENVEIRLVVARDRLRAERAEQEAADYRAALERMDDADTDDVDSDNYFLIAREALAKHRKADA